MWHPLTWAYLAGALTVALPVGACAWWRAGTLRRGRARPGGSVRELRASEAKFRGIFEEALEGIYQSSLEGRNLVANAAMARLCGYGSPAELHGAITDVATQFYVASGRRAEINARLEREGAIVGCESEVRRQDGSTFWASENVRRVHDPVTGGEVYIGSIVDVSDKRRAEAELRAAMHAAEAASRAKSAFLANMSHELRTPLNGILGFVRVMSRDPAIDARSRERLAIVDHSGEQLLHLINEVLDLSKIEAGKMELHPGPCNLPGLLMGLVDVFGPRAAEARLAFRCELDAATGPAMVRADGPRLRQVLTNLLDNAFKFTEHGAVELLVTGAGGSTRRFEVRDTGVGIAPDQQEKIFQPFQQLDNSRRDLPGTGLGLSISRRLVELMGGELRLESAPGHGSRFHFTLDLPPTVTTPAGAPGARGARPRITGHPGPARRVLVVDDEPVNRAVARALFEQVGIQVREAASGGECLEAVARLAPDLILLDLRMAPLDGFETTRRLRQTAAGRTLKILVSSAGALADSEQERLAAGADGFISKPLDVDLLFDRVADLLGLTWTYDPVETPSPPDVSPFPAVPDAPGLPPAGEIAILLALARQGDVIKLRARLQEPRNQSGAHAPFTRKLQALAAGFQLARITRVLQDAQVSHLGQP